MSANGSHQNGTKKGHGHGGAPLPCLHKVKPIPHYFSTLSMVWHTLRYILYIIFHHIYTTLQYHIVWRLTGTLQHIRDNERPENYEKSAQVLRIVFTYRYDTIVQPVSMRDFYLVHERFDHPERVLKENIDLYFVDEDKAVFTEAEEGVQQWRNEYGVEMRIAQYQQAMKVIVMPMHAATRLADKLGDPKHKLIFLSNTARCGGTLLGQIYERTGKCVMFSEPAALQSVSMYEVAKMPPAKLDKITRVVIRLYCKPVSYPADLVAYVFKPIAGALDTVSALQRVYPNAKHIFCYRDIKTMANSIQKLRYSSALVHMMWYGGKQSAWFMKQFVKMAGLSTTLSIRLTHPMGMGFVMWAACVRRYLDMRQQGVEIAGFYYDDLVANNKAAVEAVFRYTGMPLDLVDAGVEGMAHDSQGNSGISTNNFKSYASYPITPELTRLGNLITRQFGLPDIDGDMRLEGVITGQK